MRRVCLAPVVVVALLLTACRGKATKADCAKMIDHYLDLVLAEDPSLATLPPEQLAAARAMKRELKLGEKNYATVHDRCEAEVTGGQVRCALAASSAAEWNGCFR
jgi:hypothetical protein